MEEKGQMACERVKRPERDRESEGEVAFVWDPLVEREGGRAVAGGQPRSGAHWQ
jgi:hypothetical protein